MKKFVLLLIFSCGFFTWQTIKAGTGALGRFDERHPLVYEDKWDMWPYAFLDDQGIPTGFNVDLTHLLMQKLGVPYVVRLKSGKEVRQDVLDDKADLTFSLADSLNICFTTYSQSVVQQFTHSVVTMKGHPSTIHNMDDLEHEKAVVYNGSCTHRIMKQRGWDDNAVPYVDMQEAMTDLMEKGEGQIIWNTASLQWLMRLYRNDSLEISDFEMPVSKYRMVSNDKKLLDKLDSVFLELSASGEVTRLENKWFHPEIKPTGIPDWVWYVAVVAFVIALILAVYVVSYRLQLAMLNKQSQLHVNRLSTVIPLSDEEHDRQMELRWRRMHNLRMANERIDHYMRSINYVLEIGGVRLVTYKPEKRELIVYRGIQEELYRLDYERMMGMVADRSKDEVRQVTEQLDKMTGQPVEARIATVLHVKGRPLVLQFLFMPSCHQKTHQVLSYSGLCRDISEMDETHHLLARMTEEAQHAEQQKAVFLRNMSDAIRVPLQSVIGFAQLFQEEHTAEDEVTFVHQIHTNATYLMRLINDILFTSRLDAGMVELEPKLTQLKPLLERSAAEGWDELRREGVRYETHCPDEQLTATVDGLQLGRIVSELTANAAHYTQQGRVSATIERQHDGLLLTVEDTGSGMSEEMLSTVYERFASTSDGGTGLGLPICKRLVTRMGGRIDISSKLGSGTIVRVWVKAVFALLLALFVNVRVSADIHTVTISGDWDNAPFEYVDAYGTPKGYHVELISRILEKLNITYEFQLKELPAAVDQFRQHRAQLFIDPTGTFSKPDYCVSVSILGYNKLRIASLPSAPPVHSADTLGHIVKEGFVLRTNDEATRQVLQPFLSDSVELEYHSPREAMAGLVDGRYKYFIWGEQQLIRKRKELGLTYELVIQPMVLLGGEIHVASYSQQLIEAFDDVYTRMELSGEIDELRMKWLHPENLQPNASPVALYLALAATALVLMLALVIWVSRRRVHHLVRENLLHYEHELHYLLDSSDMYVFHMDAKEGMVYYYRSMESPETIMTFSEYLDCLYEEERPEAMHFMQQLSHLTEPFSVIHHFRHTPVSDTPECYVVSVMPVVKSDKESRSYLGVLRNITKLVEGQQQLRDERQRAEASARMKSAYLANMAHELRTPLNSIVGFSDLLGFVDEPEDRREFMRIILNNCDMLLRLVDDIILTQTNEQAVLTIEPTECDFAQVFNDICTSLEQRVQEPDVAFLKDNPYDHFRISVDKGRMQQILTNFVTNAVKYTHHGHIKVGYSYVDGGLRLYCEDTGAGIPMEKQASVFERFVMLNGNAVQGTGLGLNICKTIAENCGGKIGVTSEGAGYGSTFWVWIPCPRC